MLGRALLASVHLVCTASVPNIDRRQQAASVIRAGTQRIKFLHHVYVTASTEDVVQIGVSSSTHLPQLGACCICMTLHTTCRST